MEAASNLRIGRVQPSTAVLARGGVELVVAIGVLLLSAWWLDNGVGNGYVILALLVFAMIFPGRPVAGAARLGKVSGEILARWGMIFGLLLLLGWATQTLDAFDPRALVLWVVVTPIALIAAHVGISILLERALVGEGAQRTAVIVGANRMGKLLADRIGTNPQVGTRIVGYFDDRALSRLDGISPDMLLGTLVDLPGFVKARGVDVIYCSLPMCSQPRITRLVQELQDTTASIYFVPDILLCDTMRARVDTVDGVPVVALHEAPYGGFNAVIKRTLDLLLSAAILIALSPLLIAIAVGIKCGSPGPVLFGQRRYGAHGKEIVVYKFRTMMCLEDGDVVRQAREGDPRVTRFGSWLRKYSLDELPQFLNVLQGTMSVVGPRPHAVAHNEMYRKLIRGYMMRHKVKPGITGLAQVKGLRGETETIEKMRARVEIDLEYLRNWSLMLDLEIVIRTLGVLWQRENAY
jgi:putative colanic acid biosynthesis UDP-glucose lipid carrier transferase